MIQNILELLRLNDYYGEHDLIDVAKGRYEYPNTYREVLRSLKRSMKWQLKK